MKVNEKVVLEAIGLLVVTVSAIKEITLAITDSNRELELARIDAEKELELARINASKAVPQAQ